MKQPSKVLLSVALFVGAALAGTEGPDPFAFVQGGCKPGCAVLHYPNVIEGGDNPEPPPMTFEDWPRVEWLESIETPEKYSCNGMQDCAFMSAQACQSRGVAVDVEALSYDMHSTINACRFICTDSSHGRIVGCGADRRADGPECKPDFYPPSSCHRCYVGPPSPCCFESNEIDCDIKPTGPRASVTPCNGVRLDTYPPRCIEGATCADPVGDPLNGCWPKGEGEGR